MRDREINLALNDIWKRSLPEGGFASRPGGRYRADATWKMGTVPFFALQERIDLLQDIQASIIQVEGGQGVEPGDAKASVLKRIGKRE